MSFSRPNARPISFAFIVTLRTNILICTHNSAKLLKRALNFLQTAQRPERWNVETFFVANACTDETHALLDLEANP